MQRGDEKKVLLFRTNASKTCSRAPGPGAIKTIDWAPRARKHLSKRNVVLHTDGARAYQLRVDGLQHDHVVHQKKRLMKNGKVVKKCGKAVWIKPSYTKTFTHKAQSGKAVMCKGGTQVIDRLWQHLRSYLKHRAYAVHSRSMAIRIRSAQWAYWHRNDDLWMETGNILRRLNTAA